MSPNGRRGASAASRGSEAEDPWDDDKEGPNDRDDWEEAHPEEEDQYGHADGIGVYDIDPENRYLRPS